jgi:hypothetical protein
MRKPVDARNRRSGAADLLKHQLSVFFGFKLLKAIDWRIESQARPSFSHISTD